MKFGKLYQLNSVVKILNELEAKGTHQSIVNAFGTHINPTVPDLSARVVRNYIQAFLLLYDWIVWDSKTDFSRRYFTSFIDPFPRDYLNKVLTLDYQPDEAGLIGDYLSHNPTRNRALDMLPALCEIDEVAVMQGVNASERSLIKSRPAFHYRLPDCRIGDSQWSIADEWNRWWYVEMIACSDGMRQALITHWHKAQDDIRLPFSNRWPSEVRDFFLKNIETPSS